MPETDARLPAQRPRWRLALLLAALLAVGFVVAANLYLVSTTRPAIAPDVATAPARPYAIVLGNYVTPAGVPSLDLSERLDTARALYQAGRARRLVVSGLVRTGYDEPHAMAAWLVAHGVAPADVVVDVGGRRTAATMADAASMGIGSALIVSQGYHLPRALYLARHAGLDAVGVAAVTSPFPNPRLWRVRLREALARAECLLEVALRGVRA